MKHLRIFEEYYDDKGNTYQDDEVLDDDMGDVVYLNPELETFLPQLKEIKDNLRKINNDLENFGPLDEDVEDAIDAIDRVFDKWENRPINKTAKKYNL